MTTGFEEGDERRLDLRISRHKHGAGTFLERALELDNKNDMFLTLPCVVEMWQVDFSGLGSKNNLESEEGCDT
jgi:hypothetical protein